MKTHRQSWHVRKMALSLALISGMALIVSSCKKDEDDGTISTEEMVEAVSQTFTTQSGGVISVTNLSSGIVNDVKNAAATGRFADQCNIPHSKNLTGASADTATKYVWSYGLSVNWLLNCTEKVPSVFDINIAGKALYDLPRMSSEDSVTNKITVTNLEDSAMYKMTLNYSRVGTQQSKIGKMHKFTSTVTIKSTNMYLNKTTLKIASGTATVSIHGEGSGGKSFTLSGYLTFSGNDAASLVLNDTKYTVSWIK
ncbi:hypothetical protein [Chitinophaga sancti]|uniref:Uncharacterized protein n=1 Tax=Chitinophaga sancti TaxID=1004 RepID=A0A1K1RQS7_9BACT|nr:hypothetical protein [Chitinophaga sancti]WQD62507.1 hypothetical protein U0033_31945 [Chitinophaga sancti]WQG91924.1 hypothetical protein SR876_10440 [Chitinophaga sancti]SFW74242.1 hypothetical protein SAMN05661012_04125 [Chitinophaga sancti]